MSDESLCFDSARGIARRIRAREISAREVMAAFLDGIARCTRISYVEGDGSNLITVALHQIGELRGVTRRGDELVPSGKHRFGERSA